MSAYMNPLLQNMPAEPETATKPHQEVEAELLEYPVGLLAELERIADLEKRAWQVLRHNIWGIGPRTNALLQSVAEVGVMGPALKTRIGCARPAPEPRRLRPRRPEQHKQRLKVRAERSLIDIFREMQPPVGQPVGTAAESRPA